MFVIKNLFYSDKSFFLSLMVLIFTIVVIYYDICKTPLRQLWKNKINPIKKKITPRIY